MEVIYLGLLMFLSLTNAQRFNLALNTTEVEVHVDDTITIPFSLTMPESYEGVISMVGKSSDKNIATVEVPWAAAPRGHPWNDSIRVKGMMLGLTVIELDVVNYDDIVTTTEKLTVTVIRPERVIDTLFTVSVATLVSILYINFGCAMDWSVCRETLSRPIGPLIGGVCQFLIMPLLAFGIGRVLFPDNPAMQIGIFFTGISPSGGASNIWTVLLGGNLNLSIAMTSLSTLASFATIPFWIFTLGKYIFDSGNLIIPYKRIAYIAIGLVVPVAIGYLIQKKLPRVSRILVRFMKPFAVILILFIVTFAVFTNLYLFELFSWQIVLSGMGLPWLGFICGLLAMTICRQPQADIRAIAIETGIQNTGIAIFLLRFSLKQPAADLTTDTTSSAEFLDSRRISLSFPRTYGL
ncbi:ileal sodium/bile acid cotransporter isoform X3 [Diachasma alloeum]|uniref:ileal sodium/bile acid cotransporter isoform X3 n=1 Tax=Diachasma alloeum TaxID=454923 RepID=UPI00073823BF|nr:ileal sodium/bile acid cotransporter isoform X3 [Diachasma alloeum]